MTGDPVDECELAPCLNGGTCYDGAGTFQCQCSAGWTGDTCEEAVNPVYLCHGDEDDCGEHATCTHTGPGTHDCDCFLRYNRTSTGSRCVEQPTAECLPNCTLTTPPETVTTNDQAQVWHLGDPDHTCDEICSGIGLRCSDGDWHVHSEATFREALEAAGEDVDARCNRFVTRDIDPAPYVVTNGYCPAPPGQSACSTTTGPCADGTRTCGAVTDIRRFCLCRRGRR